MMLSLNGRRGRGDIGVRICTCKKGIIAKRASHRRVALGFLDGRHAVLARGRPSLRGWSRTNRSHTEIRMRVDKTAEINVLLGIGKLPGEATKEHAEEDHGNTPHVRLLRIIGTAREDLWSEVWIRTDDASGLCRCLSRIMKDNRGTKVDNLDDILLCHDAIVELEISVCESHAVEIVDAVDDLAKDAVNFWTGHLTGHDDAEQVKGSILHDLVEMAMIANDFNRFDNVRVLERGAHAKLCSNLFVIFSFRLSGLSLAKLFYGINCPAVLCLALDESYRAACTRAENFAPFTIFLGHCRVGGIFKRLVGRMPPRVLVA